MLEFKFKIGHEWLIVNNDSIGYFNCFTSDVNTRGLVNWFDSELPTLYSVNLLYRLLKDWQGTGEITVLSGY